MGLEKRKPGLFEEAGFYLSNIHGITQVDPAIFPDFSPAILLGRNIEYIPKIDFSGRAGIITTRLLVNVQEVASNAHPPN